MNLTVLDFLAIKAPIETDGFENNCPKILVNDPYL